MENCCCQHCRAKRPNLHFFTESAREEGTFEVVRCLLCGWQISRLNPWKRRPLPKIEALLLQDEPDELEILEESFQDFASKALINVAPYLGSRF